MKLDWDDGARDELREASRFYAKRARGLGRRFRNQVSQTLKRIRHDPTSHEQIRNGIHRITVSQFPYSIIYAVESNRILIVALAHHRRRSEYWTGRISDNSH